MTTEPEIANGEVKLSNGILYVQWSGVSVITAKDARAVKAQTLQLTTERTHPMLVYMSGVNWANHGVRDVFAGVWPVTRMAMLGASPVDRITADFYVARNSPACPTRFFLSYEDALNWLTRAQSECKVHSDMEVPG